MKRLSTNQENANSNNKITFFLRQKRKVSVNTFNSVIGTGEIAQWLGTLDAIPNNPGKFLSTHIWRLTTICTSSFRGSNAVFWTPQATDTYVVHRHMC